MIEVVSLLCASTISIDTHLHGSERIPTSIVVAGSMNERDIFVLWIRVEDGHREAN